MAMAIASKRIEKKKQQIENVLNRKKRENILRRCWFYILKKKYKKLIASIWFIVQIKIQIEIVEGKGEGDGENISASAYKFRAFFLQ